MTTEIALRFLLLTLALGGSAAFVTGRAIARGWQPPAQMALAAAGLALAIRFVSFALYGEALTPGLLALDYALLLAAGLAGFKLTRARQMREQYPWLSPVSGAH